MEPCQAAQNQAFAGLLEGAATEQLLELHRRDISGPGRVRLVVVVGGAGGVERSYVLADPPEADPSSFGQHLYRIWSRHDVGSVVPVIMARRHPANTCVTWARLPWGGAGAWCAACGAAAEPGPEKGLSTRGGPCADCAERGVGAPSAVWGGRP